jgi:hypothetical protein
MSPGDGSMDDMERNFRSPDRTDPRRLDEATADRLLRGAVLPDDAPPEFREVAAVLTALSAEPTPDELDDEDRHVSVIAQHFAAGSPAVPVARRDSRGRRLRVAGAVLVGSATLFVGLGVAGALPGPAQRVASHVLGTFGISAPGNDEHGGDHPDQRDHPGTTSATDDGANPASTGGRGAAPSSVPPVSTPPAAEPSTGGTGNGATVSDGASGGQSRAGEHGSGDATSPTPDTGPPATTPGATAPGRGGPPDSTPADTRPGAHPDTGPPDSKPAHP